MTRRRQAFTMVDLLILLAILAFLAALLIPATQKVRMAATRTQSINNLKQLALSVYGLHDVLNYLPPAAGEVAGVKGTVHYFVLPFIEQNSLYQGAKGDSLNVANTNIALFVDPRDTSAGPDFAYKGWLATTSYPVNCLVFNEKKMKFGNIPDGESNTFMFAQRYRMCNGEPTAWGYSILSPWTPQFGYYSQGRFQTAPSQADCDPALTQSIDSGGILVSLCDGSARVIQSDVSPQVWWNGTDPSDGAGIELD